MTKTGDFAAERMEGCTHACLDCYEICTQTAAYCLGRGGKYAAPAHMNLLLNAAEICRSAAHFMLTGSAFYAWICGLCAEVCEKTFQECEALGQDESLALCAQTCRQCAEACRELASAVRA